MRLKHHVFLLSLTFALSTLGTFAHEPDKDYVNEVSVRVEKNWSGQRVTDSAIARIFFRVKQTGEIADLRIVDSNANPGDVAHAIEAIKLAAPFKPHLEPKPVEIMITFRGTRSNTTGNSGGGATFPMNSSSPSTASSQYAGSKRPPIAFPFQPATQNPYPGLAPLRSFGVRPLYQQGLPPQWLSSGLDGEHTIEHIFSDGKFVMLNDGSVWKTDDDSESSSWTSGDSVLVRNDNIYNLDQSGEKITAECEERSCTFLIESQVAGEFHGSERPIILDNGMIFEATEYNYDYSYRPEVAVLSVSFYGTRIFKLIIEDEIYDARRLR